MTDGEALALQASVTELATCMAELATTRRDLDEALHELKFLAESHPRMCGCRTCNLIGRLTRKDPP